MQMKMNYETQRLELKVLPNTAAAQVLQFYLDNQKIFEKYETDRPKQFYTEKYQKTLLQCEYNLAVKQSAVRFWVFRKENIAQIIGTISVQDIRRGINLIIDFGGRDMQERVFLNVSGLSLMK